MPAVARLIALVIAVAMFAFSAWMYIRTGDWVAVVFALGSVAYGVYFFSKPVCTAKIMNSLCANLCIKRCCLRISNCQIRI